MSDTIRVNGVVCTNPRGLLLRDRRGMWWRLTGDTCADLTAEEEVTVEGFKRSDAQIDVYYCGKVRR